MRSRSDLARRALSQLNAGTLLAATGDYVRTDYLIDGHISDIMARGCKVCALGALFAASVSPENTYDWGVIDGRHVAYSMVLEELLQTFTQEELDEIEFEFEYGKSHPNPDTRLRNILERIAT